MKKVTDSNFFEILGKKQFCFKKKKEKEKMEKFHYLDKNHFWGQKTICGENFKKARISQI